MLPHRMLAAGAGWGVLLSSSLLLAFTGPNVPASFNPQVEKPRVSETAFIHPLAAVIGDVTVGERVFVAPFASVRADEGQPIHIGDESNVQDGVVIHGLETAEGDVQVEKNQVTADGRAYSVYIGDRTSLAHQCQVHGPAKVGSNVFIGMQSLVFKSEIGDSVVVEPGAKIIGVTIPSGRYVPAGYVVTRQEVVEILPAITPDYAFKDLNERVVHVNTQLADGYNGRWMKDEATTRQEETPEPKVETPTRLKAARTRKH